MSTFIGIPPFSNPLWVAMETMHFHIAHTNFFRTPSFRIPGVPKNSLAPMKNCPRGAKQPKLDAGVYFVCFIPFNSKLTYLSMKTLKM